MRYLLIAALSIFSFTACTSHGKTRTEKMTDNNTKMQVEDDGKRMSIRVKIRDVENPVDYKKEFDISHMSDQQKLAMKDRILDSLYKLNK